MKTESNMTRQGIRSRVASILRLAMIIALGSGTIDAMAQKQIQSPESVDDIVAIQVSDNAYVLHGLRGLPNKINRGMIANLGFIVTEQGVVTIDSGGTVEQAQLLLSEIEKVTDAPVVAVLNSHIHGDHWLGNHTILEKYPDAVIYGHPEMLNKVADGAGETWVDLYDRLTGGVGGKIVIAGPAEGISGGSTLKFGSTKFSFVEIEKAHTDNDLLIHITPDQGDSIVFLGDLSFYKRLGRMDDGHFRGNIAALDKAISLEAGVYVPGHGPTTMGPLAAQSYRDLLDTLYSSTAELYEEGLADFEIKEKISPKFEAWRDWTGFDDGFGRHVNLVYLEVEEDSF